MPPKRRRRRNGRALPAVMAVIIGLSVSGGIYWYQNPDLELSLPRGFNMPPKRRRRRNGRALPAVMAVIIGLSVSGGIYWYQNPDLELSLPRALSTALPINLPGSERRSPSLL